jgi:hypothetical protein
MGTTSDPVILEGMLRIALQMVSGKKQIGVLQQEVSNGERPPKPKTVM